MRGNELLAGWGAAAAGSPAEYPTRRAIRYGEECRANPESPASARAQRRFDVRVNAEDLIEPGNFKNWPDIFLQTGDREASAVRLDVLHSFNQHGETGAVDVAHAGEVD